MADQPHPARSQDLAVILRDFSSVLSREHTTGDILLLMGRACHRLLPVHGVGVLLRDVTAGGLTVATADTEVGRIVEQLEAQLREGPCSSTLESGQQIVEPDLALAVARYPAFAPRALDAGVRSIHALPLAMRGTTIGAVDLIALEALELTATQLAQAQLVADVAVAYLANRRAFEESTELARQLQHALDSRIVIEQAKGRLAERHGIGVTEAFERLRAYARSRGEKVAAVAAAVAAGELDV